VEEWTATVEFLIHGSLLDNNPIIVKLILGPRSDLAEVLWMFSRFNDENKRLTPKQNPYFYNGLPTFPEAYGGGFRMHPIENFEYERIDVLVDNLDHAGWVFLETAGKMWAFDNVWVTNDAIIFQDVYGMLVGESIVESAIQGIPDLSCFEEPLSPASESQPALSPNRDSPSHTVTATKITSATGKLIRDWREPIRRMLHFRDVNIRITDKPPSYSPAF